MDGDGDGDWELNLYEMGCDDAEVWTWDPGANISEMIQCPTEPDGILPFINFEDVGGGYENAFMLLDAIEMRAPDSPGSVISINWADLDISQATTPIASVRVACGGADDCNIRGDIEIRDTKELGNGPLLASGSAAETFNGEATLIEVDLTEFKDTELRITLVLFAEDPNADDIGVFSEARVYDDG